ncbi:Glutaredoxin-C6 [Wickerhamomyces ciferrii]|uniref:Glutaredoxin-C6 n=1 Tax=Wickerhamomyces ciferrii (strain ATCC 14091 / BCRC 22168 / CBS 111 / JCM 3599 / NBRC 0793 / NRRL Y-1031 F-60-10) TaxID=1206466 RepID=K0KLU5_WICCF|nr:Glutaredoxin-C6 [Wickerhamomyces ciferrii]CCH43966.1 Glutaredoxin-C6 [Wickerhamomyces ciferrii]
MASPSNLKKAQQYIDSNKFFMISKSWCPDCHYTYKIWNKYGVSSKVEVLELDKLQDQKAAIELEKAFTEISGRKWVPTIWFNGKKFGTEQDLKRFESEDKTEQIFKNEGLL